MKKPKNLLADINLRDSEDGFLHGGKWWFEGYSLWKQFVFVTFWIVVLSSVCAVVGFFVLFNYVRGQIHSRQQELVGFLADGVDLSADELQGVLSHCMNHFKDITLLDGPPSVQGKKNFCGRLLPDLRFGNVSMLGNLAVTDEVSRAAGVAVTVFVRDGNHMVRVATTLKDSSGKSSLGSELNQDGAALKSLLAGNNYIGVAEVLGSVYLTRYEPIFSGQQVVGAWFVGYPITKLKVIELRITNARLLQTGMVALVAANGRIIFHSKHVSEKKVDEILRSIRGNDSNYISQLIESPQKDCFIFSAIPSSEIYWEAVKVFLKLSWWLLLCLLIAILGLSILLLSVFRRERSFRLFSENMHDLICLYRFDGRVRYISPSVSFILGYEPEEVMGHLWEEHVHPDDWANVGKVFQQAPEKQSRVVLEYRLRKKSGGYVWVESVFRHEKDSSGRVLEVQSASRDVTATHQAEDLTFRLFQAIEQSDSSVVITDMNRIIEYVNRRFLDITGYDPGDLLGHSTEILGIRELNEEAFLTYQKLFTEGKGWRGEMRVRCKNGGIAWQLVSASPIQNKQNEITHRMFVTQDISKIKEAERKLQEAKEAAEQASWTKDEFLNIMSHELRTPLNGLLGFNDVLLHTALTPEQKEYAATMQMCGGQLLSLIERMLQFSRIRRGGASNSSQPFPLRDLLVVCSAPRQKCAAEKGVKFTCRISKETPILLSADHDNIKTVLNSLLDNAFDFTTSGWICLTASTRKYGSDEMSLIFSVEDTGSGIPSTYLEKIFSPFSQVEDSSNRSHMGIGLSLAMCRLLAQSMGGGIYVESEAGKGSVFTLEIPCVALGEEIFEKDEEW